MTILVLGRHGQLASHLRDTLGDATFWGRDDCDLGQPGAVAKAIIELGPDFIINAAAYTAVDKAESEPEIAWRINAEGPAAVAMAARTLGAPLIHVSTDFVFNGASSRPYRTDDPTRPQNVYGKSKLAGELAVETICPKHWILRTSWVFSEYGANFVKTMLRLAAEHKDLRIIDDQRGVPTYAGDLAAVITALASASGEQRPPWGYYHATGGPDTTWHGFAVEIFRQAKAAGILNEAVDVTPIPSSQFPTPARRPANSRLEPSAMIAEQLQVRMDWKHGLSTMLSQIGAD